MPYSREQERYFFYDGTKPHTEIVTQEKMFELGHIQRILHQTIITFSITGFRFDGETFSYENQIQEFIETFPHQIVQNFTQKLWNSCFVMPTSRCK